MLLIICTAALLALGSGYSFQDGENDPFQTREKDPNPVYHHYREQVVVPDMTTYYAGSILLPKLNCSTPHVVFGSTVYCGDKNNLKWIVQVATSPAHNSIMTDEKHVIRTQCRYPWGAFKFYTFDKIWCMPFEFRFPFKWPKFKYSGYFVEFGKYPMHNTPVGLYGMSGEVLVFPNGSAIDTTTRREFVDTLYVPEMLGTKNATSLHVPDQLVDTESTRDAFTSKCVTCSSHIYSVRGTRICGQPEPQWIYQIHTDYDKNTVMTNVLNLSPINCRYPWGAFTSFTFDQLWCMPNSFRFPLSWPKTKFSGHFVPLQNYPIYNTPIGLEGDTCTLVFPNGTITTYDPITEPEAAPVNPLGETPEEMLEVKASETFDFIKQALRSARRTVKYIRRNF